MDKMLGVGVTTGKMWVTVVLAQYGSSGMRETEAFLKVMHGKVHCESDEYFGVGDFCLS